MGKVISEPLTPEVIRKANARGAAIVNAPTAIGEANITVIGIGAMAQAKHEDGKSGAKHREDHFAN